MARGSRALEIYQSAARTLATQHGYTDYSKYILAPSISPQAKAWITRHMVALKRWKPAEHRTDESYARSVEQLAPYAPVLKKFKRKKKFTPQEKAVIAHKEKILKYAHHLKPLTDKQAKALGKNKLYAPGVQAIQFDNTGKITDFKVVNKDVTFASNGDHWVYWSLDKLDQRSMRTAGRKAFQVRETFPMEKIEALAKRAFRRRKAKAVYLWTAQGRVGEGFDDIEGFLDWLSAQWSAYKDTDRWIKGLAVML